MIESIQETLLQLWSGIPELLLAFIGGGIFTAYVVERWGQKRENKKILIERACALVRTYQVYVRLVRQSPDRRSESELDQAHASFMAEAKIIGFDSHLKSESTRLTDIARRLVNFRNGQVPTENQKSLLNSIFKEFNEIIDQILKYASK